MHFENFIKTRSVRENHSIVCLSVIDSVFSLHDTVLLTNYQNLLPMISLGHMCDPEELPGLAHFCEHMLFLGTKKYPVENEYQRFLNEHGKVFT